METKQLKPLPVGIQTFDKLIEGGYLYVDKTAYLYSRCRGLYTYWSCGYGDAHGQDIIPLRIEFESKAMLLHVYMDLEEFLYTKKKFIDQTTEEQKNLYWR